MAYYTNGPEQFASSQNSGLETLQGTESAALSATLEQGVTETPLWRVAGWLDHVGQSGQPTMAPDDLNQKYGIPGLLKFDRPTPEQTARHLYEDKHAQAIREATIASGPSTLGTNVLNFTAGQIPQFLDPINVASMFVPGLGDARVAAALGQASERAAAMGADGVSGLLARQAARTTRMGAALNKTFAGRAVRSASQGVTGQTALEPLDYVLDQDEHNDWTAGQAIRDLGFGAVAGLLGSFVHGREHVSEPELTEASDHAPARRLADLPSDQRGAVLHEGIAAASEGRDPVTSEMADVFDPANAAPHIGPFGPVFPEFRGNAEGAVEKLLQEKTGEAPGALTHPDIGPIDLIWGKEGTGKSDGYGLSKLARFHPEVLNNLQGILDGMSVRSRSANRAQLESPDHYATVRLTYNSEKKHWLLTAFQKDGARNARKNVASSVAANEAVRRADFGRENISRDARTDTTSLASADDTASHGTDASSSIAPEQGDFQANPDEVTQDMAQFYQQARTEAQRSFVDAAQASATSLPSSEARAVRETGFASRNAPAVTGGAEDMAEAQKALDQINTQLGIGSEHLAIPDAAKTELDQIHEQRKIDDGTASAFEAAGACLARNV